MLTLVQGRRLREYPTGMSLAVPPIVTSVTHMATHGSVDNTIPQTTPQALGPDIKPIDIKFDLNRQEVIFETGQSNPVRNGDWVVITTPGVQTNGFGARRLPVKLP